MTGMSLRPLSRLISLSSWNPSMPDMRTSVITRAGRSSRIFLKPSSPSSADTTSYPCTDSVSARRRRWLWSSSITSIFIFELSHLHETRRPSALLYQLQKMLHQLWIERYPAPFLQDFHDLFQRFRLLV